MSLFEDAIQILGRDFFEIVLPFILLFTISYAVLMKIAIFKEKQVNVAIAFVIGLVPVFQHVLYGGRNSAITIINNSIPQVTLILVAVLALLILLGLWGLKPGYDQKAGGVVVIGAVAFIAYIFLSNAGFGWYNLPRWIDRGTITIVVALLIFGLIIKFIVGGPDLTEEQKKKKQEESFLRGLGRMVEATGKKKE